MAKTRDTLVVTESLTKGSPNARDSLVITESLTKGYPHLRDSLVVIDSLTAGYPHLRVALMCIEVLCPTQGPLPVATLRFPSLRGGMKWDRAKNPSYNNARREMTTGRRAVTPFMVYPRWNFELDYEVMPDTRYLSGMNNTLDSVQSIIDLFKNTAGGAYTFLYQDPDDYHVVGGSITTGDGVTLQWPFFAAVMGTVLEPVGQVDFTTLASFAYTAVNTSNSEVTIAGHGFTNGQGPMFLSSSGTLPSGAAANTAYWVIVVDANTVRLATTSPNALAGVYVTLTTQGTGTLALAKGFGVYGARTATLSVPGSGPYTLTPDTTGFVQDYGVTHSGTALTKVSGTPASNQYAVSAAGVYTFNVAQAGQSMVISYQHLYQASEVSITLPNQIVFATAPASGVVVTADFDYYFVCRFDDDKLETNEFAQRLYELQKVTFSSEVS